MTMSGSSIVNDDQSNDLRGACFLSIRLGTREVAAWSHELTVAFSVIEKLIPMVVQNSQGERYRDGNLKKLHSLSALREPARA